MTARRRIQRTYAGAARDRHWAVYDTAAVPSDHNYWGLLANGCETLSDALACAVEYGWVARSGDSAGVAPHGGVALRGTRQAGRVAHD